MDFTRIDAHLLSHPGASKAFHEKWGWMVYWVGGRQFACELEAKPGAKEPYAGRHLLSLKCDPDRILELRAEHPDAILPYEGFAHSVGSRRCEALRAQEVHIPSLRPFVKGASDRIRLFADFAGYRAIAW